MILSIDWADISESHHWNSDWYALQYCIPSEFHAFHRRFFLFYGTELKKKENIDIITLKSFKTYTISLRPFI